TPVDAAAPHERSTARAFAPRAKQVPHELFLEFLGLGGLRCFAPAAMIGQGFRRRRDVTISMILLAMASTISVACAFSPATLLPQIEMRRPVIQARRLWWSARSRSRSSFTLVRNATEWEDIRKEVLANAVDNILFNKDGFDRVVGSALHSVHPPHYEKLASALPSLSNLHLHPHLPGVTAHAIAAALPAVAMDHASIEHLLATLPAWAVIPGVALLAATAALPPHTDTSAASSIVPTHRALSKVGEAPRGKAKLSRGQRIKAARAP
ncbi:hypothetical protein T484DRAFT_3638568, partial [Baffinella frigidus]